MCFVIVMSYDPTLSAEFAIGQSWDPNSLAPGATSGPRGRSEGTTEAGSQVGLAPPRLKTIEEAAQWLNVPASWLRKAVSARRVPFRRIDKHVGFTQAHLGAIVDAGEPVKPARAVRTRL